MTFFEITENSVILPKNKIGIIIKDIDLNKQNDITYLTEKHPDLNIQNIKWYFIFLGYNYKKKL